MERPAPHGTFKALYNQTEVYPVFMFAEADVEMLSRSTRMQCGARPPEWAFLSIASRVFVHDAVGAIVAAAQEARAAALVVATVIVPGASAAGEARRLGLRQAVVR